MKYEIAVPKPCHENWNKMTTTEKGKFCGKCNKVVADLTTLTDRQLISIVNSEKNMCGRLYTSQLNRTLEEHSKKVNPTKVAIGLAFATFLASSEPSIAQAHTPETNQISFKQGKVFINKSTSQKTITIKGNISDVNGNLPGVTIILKGTTHGTETDFDGNFSLEIPNKKLKSTILVVSYLGYKTIEKDILSIKKPLKITMEESGEVLGGISVVAGMIEIKKPTFFQRIGNIFKKEENKK